MYKFRVYIDADDMFDAQKAVDYLCDQYQLTPKEISFE